MHHQKPNSLFGELSTEEFLTQHWQKKPLLVRNAMPGFVSPVSPDELAGLACDDAVESRIILELGGKHPWELRFGPFEASSFSDLPATHWTLLVQECNKHVAQLALLLDQFSFIPNWRVDDVMVSYAAPNGSVGPHQDQYDVFLIQGLGHRHWQISTQAVNSDGLLANTDLRLLNNFRAQQEWTLAPGDLLYLPPSVAHYGVARDDCITLSVGFRAPSHYELVTAFMESQFTALRDEFEQPRYTDPPLNGQDPSGRISDATVQRIKTIVDTYAGSKEQIKHWFARYASEPKSDAEALQPAQPLSATSLITALESHGELLRSEYARFVYTDTQQGGKSLYINTNEYQLSANIAFAAALLCGQRQYSHRLLATHFNNTEFVELLTSLYNQGFLYFPDTP